MSTQRRESKGRRGARGRIFLLEPLEDRRLLATGAFTGPSLAGLISQAYHGKDTAQATIKTMLSALESQLTDGPLADLNSNVVDGSGFVTEVQGVVTSYNQNVDQQLAHFTHIDNMLKLQGQQVVANLVSLNQQTTVGLISADVLPTQAGAAINTLTSGPIYSLNTPVSAYVTATQNFETDIGAVADALSSTAPVPLALSDVSTTIQAEAEAYRASMDAGLQVTHPDLSSPVNASITTLESSVIAIANANNSTAEADIHNAIAIFDSAILDTTGLFGLNGLVNRVNSEFGYVPHDLTGVQTGTTIGSVSGTAAFGGTATLTATLKSATGTGLGGKVISFTLDGGFAGTAVTNSSGVATLTGVTQSDAVGTDAGGVVASFFGDSTNLLSQNSGDLVVSLSSTTTTLTSGTNPSASGASVTFTAVVAAGPTGSGTPTGTVDFLDNGTQIGTGTLDSTGTATFATSTLTVGTHPITAVYEGDTNFTTSTSSVVNQVVMQASTTTLTTSGTPSASGAAVTFTATVAPSSGTGTPTGTVNFLDGTTVLASDVALTAGVASFTTSTTSPLALGTHSITAVYSGDTTYAPSTSSPLSQVVVNSASTTTVTSSANPSVSGESVTFTANVTASSGTPTGTVNFLDGTTVLASGVALTSGSASYIATGLTVGTHPITAVYSGDANFATSTSPAVSQVVNQASTTTVLTPIPTPNPSVFGQSVTFSATVTPTAPGTGTPTGTVNFYDGATLIGSNTLTGGVATFSDSALAVGSHSITATYVASTNFAGSSSTAVSQVVNQANTTTGLVSSLNPSTSGASVMFTATVSAASPGSGTPTGTVTFNDGSTAIGLPVTLSGGVASVTTSTLTAGVHSITADYSGDTNFATSTSTPALSQTVNQAPQITSTNAATFTQGTPGTFTVTTTGYPISTLTETGETLPTGVTFVDNGNDTATIASTAATPTSTTTFMITAANGITPNATQSFTLNVS